jgi:hypothetical protein
MNESQFKPFLQKKKYFLAACQQHAPIGKVSNSCCTAKILSCVNFSVIFMTKLDLDQLQDDKYVMPFSATL